MRYYLAFFLAIFVIEQVSASDTLQYRPITISVFSNATAMPGSTVIKTSAVHPGVCVGTALFLNNSSKNQWFQTAKLGYYYHQYSQHALQLYTENGINHNFRFPLSVGIAGGAGLLLSKADLQVYKLNSNGHYESTSGIRLQAMIVVTPEISWNFKLKSGLPLRIFAHYQLWFQLPYVKQYVPILPNVSTHVGIAIPFTLKK